MPQVDPHHLVGVVLNSLEVTGSAYHELAYTRPLVEDLVGYLARFVPPGGRVLLVGGTSLLACSVLAAGYDLELWRLGNQLLAGELAEHVRAELTPSRIADADLPRRDVRFDAILLPRVIEHVPASPASIFALFQPHLRQGGILVVATRNLAAIGLRLRALRGNNYLPAWQPENEMAFSLSWPDLPEFHYYQLEELLAYAQQEGLSSLAHGYSMGRLPYERTGSFGLRDYLARIGTHWIKMVAPPVRDYILLALGTAMRNSEGGAPSLPLEEAPHVRR